MKLPFIKRKSADIEETPLQEELNIKDIIAPPYISIAQDQINLGDKIAKSFFIFSYPRYLNTGWLSPAINLNTPMDISFFIHPVSSEQILKKLRSKITQVASELIERQEKGLIRDPILETGYQDIEALRDKIITAQEKMFRLGLYITIYENSQEAIRETETTLRSIFESRLIYIKPALFKQKDGFISCLPYGLDLLYINTPMDTEPISTTFPFVSFDLSSNEGILYGINGHNNSLVLFDRFTLENSNMVVFATSGAGKSILGTEPVLIKQDGKIQLKTIGPLVEKLIKKHGAQKIDEELEGVIEPNLEVYSFDKNLKGSWSNVSVAARKDATEFFYKFKTKSGREITTTGDHNMVVLKNGKVITAKSSDVKEGEYIPLPRFVSATDSPTKSINLLDLLRGSDNVYLLGAEKIIEENYTILKSRILNEGMDRYLYKYKAGRAIPIMYFWKILDSLKIKTNDPQLDNIKIVSKNGKNKYSFDRDFKITANFLRIAGFICAEGTIRNEVIIISNNDAEVLRDIDFSLKELRVPFYYGNNGIIIATRIFVEIIKAMGGKAKSGNKKVLPLLFGLKKELVAHYLRGYFEGDGGIDGSMVSATSKSKRLISEICYLLLYFGITGRILETKKQPTNSNWKHKKIYYKLTVSGQDNLRKFNHHINFISRKKQQRLCEITKKEGNTNVDVIPEVKTYFEEIYRLFGHQLAGIPGVSAFKNGAYSPSRDNLQKTIEKIEKRILDFRELSPKFEKLSGLPSLSILVKEGKVNKILNGRLWQALGASWQLMKNNLVQPKSINVFRAIKTVYGESYNLAEVKTAIHCGFKEMNLPIRYFNRSLQSALVRRYSGNTRYNIVQSSAQFVWQNYQDILNNKITRVQEILGDLKMLANSDLFWDPITQIKKIINKKEKYVYDLTVDNEVFLAGNGGMFVHNSYAIKLEILRYLMWSIDVIVVDPENEYEMLAEGVGGEFFKISLTSQNHVNPFDLPIPGPDDDPEDILRSNIINLVGLLRIMLGGLTAEEDSILDQALTETYAIRDITPQSDPAKWQENIPIMSDFEEILENMKGAESLARRIKKFTQGTFAGFFNQKSNITLSKKFIVFGIKDMEESLKPIALFIIMRYIWNIIRTHVKKRILVVDEAWWLMQSEDGASFLFGLVKRGRKYWLGVTTITQDIEDFMKSSYGKAIITNSSLQLLLKQSPAEVDIVQKTFDLTDQEKFLLLEAAVGEGLFFAGKKHVYIAVKASYTEDQIITTAPQEVERIKEARRRLSKDRAQ